MPILDSLRYYLGLAWKSDPLTRIDALLNRRAWIALGRERVAIGGRALSRKQIQILSGCPGGGAVHVQTLHNDIRFVVAHSKYIREFNIVEIRKAKDGNVLYLDYIWFNNVPAGFGAVAFLRMAQLAKTLGFVRIELLAAGGTGEKGRTWSEDFWGYEFWPRLGFDAPLQEIIRHQLRSHPVLSNATMVSQVVLADLDWWKRHGDGWEMTFELVDRSPSWYTLKRYIASRKGLLS